VKKPRGRSLNLTQVAEVFGVVPSTVSAWLRRGLPALKRSTGRGSGANGWVFDSAAVSEWLREDALEASVSKVDGVSIAEGRRRKVLAQAALAELEVARMQAELVPAEEISRVWGRMVGNCRARLLAIPSKLAPRLITLADQEAVYAELKHEIYEALTELASKENDEALSTDENASALIAELEGGLVAQPESEGTVVALETRDGTRPLSVSE
jgi:phage terminase Nu1 subunit (DNA packaging protein)